MDAYFEKHHYYSKLPIEATLFENDFCLPQWHTEIELALVCEGKLLVGVNSESRILKKGDIAICHSKDIHFYDSRGRDSVIMNIIFRPELIGYSSFNWPSINRINYPFICYDDKSVSSFNNAVFEEFKACFENIYREANSLDESSLVFVKSELLRFTGLLLRHIPHHSYNTPSHYSTVRSIHLIQSAIQYIENNFSKEITLVDISKHLGISAFYLSKIFNRITGISIKEYLNRKRIEKAERLIEAGEKAIMEIAMDCGFSSLRTFNRVFKLIKGHTPSSLRENS